MAGTALSAGTITGTVTDAETDKPLAGANVMVRNSFIGTATDRTGQFRLDNLDTGRVTLVVSMIGYKQIILQDIRITDRETQRFAFELQPDIIASPQVVVTASRQAQDIMEAPFSTAVLSPRDIQSKAAVSLEEVLPYEPGVSIVKDQLNIRGATGYTLGAGNRSLLLLDGVPLLGSAAGNMTWAMIPTSEIAQVEIVKSGGSALYGSSAMGGVVNVITRATPSQPETRIRSRSGFYSQPKYEQWEGRKGLGLFSTLELTHARPFGSHGMWVRAQMRHSDGYTELNWEDALNFTGKVKLNFGSNYNASLYANILADCRGLESQWRSPADPFEAPFGSEDDRAQGTKINVNGFINRIQSSKMVLRLRGALYDVRWKNFGSNTDYSNETKLFGETQMETTWNSQFNTTLGVSIQRARIDARIFGQHSSLSLAAYGLAQRRVARIWTLSLGGRVESYQVDGQELDSRFTPQIAVNGHLNEALSVRGSIGYGFRVPTIAEMYSRSQLSVFKVEPNPDLVAETSVASELGISLMLPGNGILDGLMLEGALFQTRFQDLIEPKPDRYGIIHFENLTEARIEGLDLGVSTSIWRRTLELGVTYTYLNPVEIDDAGEVTDTLSYRYRHHLVPTLAAHWRNWSLSVDTRQASRMESTELFAEDPVTGRDKRVPIRVWNAGLEYRHNRLTALIRIENIFQYYYVELERNMGEERNVALTVQWQF